MNILLLIISAAIIIWLTYVNSNLKKALREHEQRQALAEEKAALQKKIVEQNINDGKKYHL